jgi:large subunit ribosomal protein L24
MKTRLKVNDNVVVISGSGKGKRGRLLKINKTKGLALVEGVNKKHKAVKATQENPKGGVTQKEYPIQISNVMFFCDKCKKGVKLQIVDATDDKGKGRKCSKCGKTI